MNPIKYLPAFALALAAASGNAAGPDSAAPKRFSRRADRFTRSCADAMPGLARCHAWARAEPDVPIVVVGEPTFPTPEDFITPGDLAQAYALPSHGGEGVLVAIVDAFDDPTAESDLAAYRSHFDLPACTTAIGCFRKVNQGGAASPLPSVDNGWAGEISLDLDMVSAACPKCNILLVEANSASTADLGAAVNMAVALGARVVSNSYGIGESSGDPTTFNAYYNHPGTLIVASSGDSGFGVQFPAAAPSVLAVGGTHLVTSTSARGWTETAWSGAGSGCSSVETKPSWQADTGCTHRTVADVSAVADPATAVSVYQTTPASVGGWTAYGGTSVAAPLMAATFVVTGRFASQFPYGSPSKFFDVVGGSNGTCSPTYLCTAVTGYDGPTGIGSPDGAAMAIPLVASQMVVLSNL
jgi:subtilase family serine protease